MTTTVPLAGNFLEVVSPTQPSTPAGRFLSRQHTPAAGYMLIMQSAHAAARRRAIELRGGKVIYAHDAPGSPSICVQYHPKTVPGGIIPELDAHAPTPAFPDPVAAPFSPWHAVELPLAQYAPAMERAAGLQIRGLLCRLEVGDGDVGGAVGRWRDVFGTPTRGERVVFTNAELGFLPGMEGKRPGLERVTIAVRGQKKFDAILDAAREEGICGDGWINMCGVEWVFEYVGESEMKSKM
jgi:hypothetical protein